MLTDVLDETRAKLAAEKARADAAEAKLDACEAAMMKAAVQCGRTQNTLDKVRTELAETQAVVRQVVVDLDASAYLSRRSIAAIDRLRALLPKEP